MCGIVGFVGFGVPQGYKILEHACNQLRHRGPDHQGIWVSENQQIGLAQRRLAIVDLSQAGHQPMHSQDGRWVLVLNGEIYNFHDLQKQLDQERHGFAWKGHSDTEVFLAAIQAWGLKTALHEAVGMFALALWDQQEHRLILARDRMGEKPLYYGQVGPSFVFASELKAITSWSHFSASVDQRALSLFCQYGYIPAPLSLYQGVSKLPAGHMLVLQQGKTPSNPIAWWSLEQNLEAGLSDPFAGTQDDLVAQLDDVLRQAVARQMRADVPLGALLSGGIDSSLVVALMQAQGTKPVKTFCIGFDHPDYNEAPFARDVAQHLGCDHHELYLNAQDVMAVIPEMPQIYDEPFADSSQLLTLLIARLARENVTVALSGDGGDELFGGYTRYHRIPALWTYISTIPYGLRRNIVKLMHQLPLHEKWHKALDWAASPDLYSLYDQCCRIWHDPQQILMSSDPCPDWIAQRGRAQSIHHGAHALADLDCAVYLPDDLCVKLDRAAMRVSLETRLPFLDRDVLRLAFQIEWGAKAGQGKLLLRKLLAQYMPPALFERPKQGFNLPLKDWLRGDLRDWMCDLLAPDALKRQGLIRHEYAQQILHEHLQGVRDHSQRLWTLMMLQSTLVGAISD